MGSNINFTLLSLLGLLTVLLWSLTVSKMFHFVHYNLNTLIIYIAKIMLSPIPVKAI